MLTAKNVRIFVLYFMQRKISVNSFDSWQKKQQQ